MQRNTRQRDAIRAALAAAGRPLSPQEVLAGARAGHARPRDRHRLPHAQGAARGRLVARRRAARRARRATSWPASGTTTTSTAAPATASSRSRPARRASAGCCPAASGSSGTRSSSTASAPAARGRHEPGSAAPAPRRRALPAGPAPGRPRRGRWRRASHLAPRRAPRTARLRVAVTVPPQAWLVRRIGGERVERRGAAAARRLRAHLRADAAAGRAPRRCTARRRSRPPGLALRAPPARRHAAAPRAAARWSSP